MPKYLSPKYLRTCLALTAALAVVATGCDDETMMGRDGGGMDGAVDGVDSGPGEVDAGPPALCAADHDCDDGDYCNGEETCVIGAPGAGADGCLPGAAPCDAAGGESCDEDMDRCVAAGCEGSDADLDGDGDPRPECGGADCDDSDPNIYSTATEVCDADGVDEDCDPSTIRDTSTTDGDVDGDGFVSDRCFNTRPDGSENRGNDCDDVRPTVNIDGVESCNSVDDDCDTRVDEGVLTTYYFDGDSDGYGTPDVAMEACFRPMGYSGNDDDCQDAVTDEFPVPQAIHPGADEDCDGVDNNCSGTADDPPGGCACTTGDVRGCGPLPVFDGVGLCRRSTQRCVAGEWPASCPGSVYPTAIDGCDAQDNDCDGSVDEDGLAPFYYDSDRDGYGDPTRRMDFCPTLVVSPYVPRTECDDSDSTINPGATEICDGRDNNCSGTADDVPGGCGCTVPSTQGCGHATIGVCVEGEQSCQPDGTWGTCVGNTEPTSPAELCGGGDEDCDGLTNDDDPDVHDPMLGASRGASEWWLDTDGDSFGDPGHAVWACTAPAGYVAPGLPDCWPTSYGRHAIDCYPDVDGDGYGSGSAAQRCTCLSNEVTNNADCVDNGGSRSALIHPGAAFQTEAHCNGRPAGCTSVFAGYLPNGCVTRSGAILVCRTSGSFDYNCDSVVTPRPPGSRCLVAGIAACWGPPTSSHSSSDCGTDVDYHTCTASCSDGPIQRQPLACR